MTGLAQRFRLEADLATLLNPHLWLVEDKRHVDVLREDEILVAFQDNTATALTVVCYTTDRRKVLEYNR